MRHTDDISRGWLMTVKANDGTPYAPTEINLPFIHSAEDFSLVIIEKEIELCGENVPKAFLELYGITGNVRVLANCKPLADRSCMQTMFRAPFASAVTETPEKIKLRIEITPRPRTDGRMIIGRIHILYLGEIHFETGEDGGCGVMTSGEITEDGALLNVGYKINNPEDGDIINAVLRDADGSVISVKSGTAEEGSLTLETAKDSVWCRPRYIKRMLDISLLRNTMLLDSMLLPVSVYNEKLENGLLSRNNEAPEKMLGVYLHDLSQVRRDLAVLRDAGVKAVHLTSLTAKTCIFDLLDDMGLTGWYDLPYTGRGEDFDNLAEMLSQYSCHPSFRFICCSAKADNSYAEKFISLVNDKNCGVLPVLDYDLSESRPLPAVLPSVINAVVSADRSGKTDYNFADAFGKLVSSAEGCAFSVSVNTPADLSGGETAISGLHKNIFTKLSVITPLVCWFAGNIKNTATEYGIYSGSSLNLAGEMYLAAFSKQEFLRIEGNGSCKCAEREAEITVFSNNPAFKILVNSKPPKNPVITKLCDGVYTIGGLKLSAKPTLIEISAGENCDNITIYRGR